MSIPTAILDPETLSRLQLFRDVDLNSISGILDTCKKIDLKKGDVILSPKISNNAIYILICGQMFVHLNSVDSEPLDTVGPGESVGEMSVFDNTYPSAFVVAGRESTILAIESQILWKLIDRSSAIARNLIYMLSQRIRYGHETISNSWQNEREQKIHANIDSLTGLHNRRWLDHMFSREIHRCETGSASVCLVMADIDHFKRVNDEFGHLLGDKVLRTVAETMHKFIRPNDMIGRFGGEEFLILLPRTEIADAMNLADRVRIAVQEVVIDQNTSNDSLFVTVSLGIAQRMRGEKLEALIARADTALYKAKNAGRNRAERY